jgi:hypothetical protein
VLVVSAETQAARVIQEVLVALELQETQVIMASPAQAEQQELPEQQGTQGYKVMLETLETQELMVLGVQVEQQEMVEQQETLVTKEHQAILVTQDLTE